MIVSRLITPVAGPHPGHQMLRPFKMSSTTPSQQLPWFPRNKHLMRTIAEIKDSNYITLFLSLSAGEMRPCEWLRRS